VFTSPTRQFCRVGGVFSADTMQLDSFVASASAVCIGHYGYTNLVENKFLSTNNMHTVRECQQMFHFELPSEQMEK